MRRGLATAALVALLVVDVVLVAVALRPGGLHGPPPAATPATLVSDGPASTPATTGAATGTTDAPTDPATSTATTRPTTTATTAAQPTAATPVAVLVAGVDASTAYRAATGTCSAGGAMLEVTTDGGTWRALRPPARALARVQPLDAGRVFVIGSSAACEPRQYASRDRGATWQAPTAVTGSWARRLDDPTSIVAPEATGVKPCGGATVVDLSRTSATRAQALCGGGDVVGSSDGGRTWRPEGRAAGGVALSNLDLSNLDGAGVATYVARVAPGCAGVQVARVGTDRTTAVACVGTAVPRPGLVALSVTPQAGWLVVGDRTWTAAGDLRSWRQV